uniref:Uncharacterized protein n=1 Tax=Cacopsylla melanoneura TaxID=428564 RepID=A0A8D8WRE9_9HEMI
MGPDVERPGRYAAGAQGGTEPHRSRCMQARGQQQITCRQSSTPPQAKHPSQLSSVRLRLDDGQGRRPPPTPGTPSLNLAHQKLPAGGSGAGGGAAPTSVAYYHYQLQQWRRAKSLARK